MKCLTLLCLVAAAQAHRLDEYLQATTITLEARRVAVQIRLTPGVAVFPVVMAGIDRDGDGSLSAGEQRDYLRRLRADLSLKLDGVRLSLEPSALRFPTIEEMRDGRGEIEVDFLAEAPGGAGVRRLEFENRHQRVISTYLVNCLAPEDAAIRVTGQTRDYEQSRYELAYDVRPDGICQVWMGGLGLLLAARFGMLGRRWYIENRKLEPWLTQFHF